MEEKRKNILPFKGSMALLTADFQCNVVSSPWRTIAGGHPFSSTSILGGPSYYIKKGSVALPSLGVYQLTLGTWFQSSFNHHQQECHELRILPLNCMPLSRCRAAHRNSLALGRNRGCAHSAEEFCGPGEFLSGKTGLLLA
jgi:hypothetical protein